MGLGGGSFTEDCNEDDEEGGDWVGACHYGWLWGLRVLCFEETMGFFWIGVWIMGSSEYVGCQRTSGFFITLMTYIYCKLQTIVDQR